MARPKTLQDGVSVSLYLDRELLERIIARYEEIDGVSSRNDFLRRLLLCGLDHFGNGGKQ